MDAGVYGVLVAIVSLIGVLGSLYDTRKRMAVMTQRQEELLKAQAQQVHVSADVSMGDAAIKLLEPYKKEVFDLRCRVDLMEKQRDMDLITIHTQRDQLAEASQQIAKLQAQVAILTQQVVALGGRPITELNR
jgi:hypothetical protein